MISLSSPPPDGANPRASKLLRIKKFIASVGFVIAIVAMGMSFHLRSAADQQLAAENQKAREWANELAAARSRETFSTLPVTRGARFTDLLRRANLDAQTTNAIIEAARPVTDFRRIRQGQTVLLGRSSEGVFTSLRYRLDRDRE